MNLRTKLAIGFSSILLVTGVTFFLFFSTSFQESIQAIQLKNQDMLARHIQRHIVEALDRHDPGEMKRIAQSLLETLPDMMYIVIVGTGGEILATTADRETPSSLLVPGLLDKGKPFINRRVSTPRGLIRNFVLPLAPSMDAELHVGMSEQLHDQTAKTLRHTGILLIGCFFLGFLLIVIISHRLSRPLTELSVALEKIGKGDLEYRLKEQGDTQILSLIRGFNRMAGSLNTESLRLRKNEERYKTIMNSMKEMVYIRAHDFRVEYMNKAMIESIGRDATGEYCFQAIYNRDEPCLWCNLKAMEENRYFESEIVSPRNQRTYHVTHSPILTPGEPGATMKIFRDITRIKKMENQLIQAQKLEAIGTLTGGIAHDFNNILFPVIGYSEMMKDDIPENSPLRESLDMILSGAIRARDLVKQLLTFCRQNETEPMPLKMQIIIKEALKFLRSSLPSTLRINQNIDNNCGFVMADPVQIHQLIMNLCTNAFDAIPDRKGTLTVALFEADQKADVIHTQTVNPGRYACLTIKDTGKGMTQSVIDRIFNPFFTTKETGKASGLGLSVVHGIIKKLGGHIRVSSEPGLGTEFQVYIPLLDSASQSGNGKGSNPIQGGTERILLIDDQEEIIALEREILEKLGYTVIPETSSSRALDLFAADPNGVDLVITDMTMPAMTGNELAKSMLSLRPDLPIILLTGFSDQISQDEAKEMGIKGFLMKPVLKKDLAFTIRNILH
ncbi:MAG: ATP-binding protein [Pseudomonadota bacterium]